MSKAVAAYHEFLPFLRLLCPATENEQLFEFFALGECVVQNMALSFHIGNGRQPL